MAENSLLERLDGLEHKFEEISTLITDPAVIADMKRYVKLNKEYHDLELIMNARKEYKNALSNIAQAKEILDSESDPEMREMAKMELDEYEPKLPEMEERIKILLIPSDPEDAKNAIVPFLTPANTTAATRTMNTEKSTLKYYSKLLQCGDSEIEAIAKQRIQEIKGK